MANSKSANPLNSALKRRLDWIGKRSVYLCGYWRGLDSGCVRDTRYSVGFVREQVSVDVSFLQIFEDYFTNWGIATLLTMIGVVTVGLGLRR